jgi:hypothetical protein
MTTDTLVKTIVVPARPAAAFRRFTEEVDLWWPRGDHSVFQDRCARVTMEGRVGGRFYEISDSGEESDWGRLTVWDPPRRAVFSWHPGREPATAQEVEVSFREVADGTEVRLEHRGWDSLGDAAVETMAAYDQGWNGVLALYRDSVGKS